MHWLEGMPAADFALYQAYAAERLLPMQRLELHLARIGMQLDILAGRQARPLDDYLIPNRNAAKKTTDANDLTEEQADAIATDIGFSPRPRRRPANPAQPEAPAP